LCGVVGLGVDVGLWYRGQRALQNAADSAAVAAALNGRAAYQSEAKSVAAQYGFIDGAGGVTVTALNNQTCPNGSTNCYLVTITQTPSPLYFSAVLGIAAPTLSGAAMASAANQFPYCILALAGSGTNPAIVSKGGSHAD